MITAPEKLVVRALLHWTFPEQFCPRMLQHVTEIRRKAIFQDSWSQDSMTLPPKEPGNLNVDKQHPLMLLNTRAKWPRRFSGWGWTTV